MNYVLLISWSIDLSTSSFCAENISAFSIALRSLLLVNIACFAFLEISNSLPNLSSNITAYLEFKKCPKENPNPIQHTSYIKLK